MNNSSFSKLHDAAQDLRYLLNKGYPRANSIILVGDRYNLTHNARHLLYRGVFSRRDSAMRKKKLLPVGRIKGRSLGIDGHNVLITLESALKDRVLIHSDDGLVRDIAGISHRYRLTKDAERALDIIFAVLGSYRPARIAFFFDAPISKSGELARLVKRRLEGLRLKGTSKAVKVPEKELVNYEIIATSDSALIDKSVKVVDLAGFIINRRLSCRPLSFSATS